MNRRSFLVLLVAVCGGISTLPCENKITKLDLRFIKTRTFSVEYISRVYNIPVPVLMALSLPATNLPPDDRLRKKD